MKKYNLELIVFICGAVIMILEIAGSRIMAPHLGTSLFVWTSLIGVILGSLSIGYWFGGSLADKKANFKIFSLIIFFSAISVILIALSKEFILTLITAKITDIRLGSIIASVILFAPPGILMGMISPYAVKLKLENLQNSGRTIGNLYAISTIGSIVGTFLAGFFLLTYFGNTKLLIILSATLMLTSTLAYNKNLIFKLTITALILSYCFNINYQEQKLAKAGTIELETAYSHVKIFNGYSNNRPVKVLSLGQKDNSAIYLDSDDLVFRINRFYRLAKHFLPDAKSALMIGAGAYSYPKDFLKNFPQAEMDTVEIDPKLTELAKKYFNLKEDPRLHIYHEDGRTFLNKNVKQYDIIFGDAFKSFYSIPYQLTTLEAVKKMYDSLNDNGIILINVISSIDGKNSKFFKAEYKTYKAVFPQVYVFTVQQPDDEASRQNLLLLALKSTEKPNMESTDQELNSYLRLLYKKQIKEDYPILTDDFAPVDQYIMELL